METTYYGIVNIESGKIENISIRKDELYDTLFYQGELLTNIKLGIGYNTMILTDSEVLAFRVRCWRCT